MESGKTSQKVYQFNSVAQLCLTLRNPTDCSMPGFPVHHQLPELTQTHVHQVSDAIQPSHPVVPFSSHLQSFPASESFLMNQSFASGGQSIKSFSFSIRPSNEYSGVISFGIDLLSKILSRVFLTPDSLKASIFWCSAFFMVQFSHLYMTLGKAKL